MTVGVVDEPFAWPVSNPAAVIVVAGVIAGRLRPNIIEITPHRFTLAVPKHGSKDTVSMVCSDISLVSSVANIKASSSVLILSLKSIAGVDDAGSRSVGELRVYYVAKTHKLQAELQAELRTNFKVDTADKTLVPHIPLRRLMDWLLAIGT